MKQSTQLTQNILDVEKIREEFPILKRVVNGNKLVYLDNASTTQKPLPVINAISEYYKNYNANIHRGVYKISEEATIAYEQAHEKVADLINANFEETIFTRSTTESVNLLAYSLSKTLPLKKDDEILITELEHHSNFVPWQQIAKQTGTKLKFIKLNRNTYELDLNNLEITDKTKIISVSHISNVLGTINPVKEIGKIAKENNSIFIVDAAQSVPHMEVDVKEINADFIAFSSHKMLGPTGVGVLYGKQQLLENLQPFNYGGDMIKRVTFSDTEFNDLPWKFEAGTQNIADGIAFGVAVDYLNNIGLEKIRVYEKELRDYAIEKLSKIDSIKIYSPENGASIISFNLNNIHAHDVCTILDKFGIAVRGGHHCAMPLMSLLKVSGTARASFYFYNTKDEVDKLVEGLKEVKKVFS